MRIRNFQFSIFNFQFEKGFTLIEILVAATIIAVLATIGMTSYQVAVRNGRDAKRKADLEQIRSALELYKSDKGYYPTPSAAYIWHNLADPEDAVNIELVSGGYINPMPIDPKNNDKNPACGLPPAKEFGYFYWYLNSRRYELIAGLEGQATTNCRYSCGGEFAPSSCYVVNNP